MEQKASRTLRIERSSFFNRRVFNLSGSQFATEKSERLSRLFDNGTKLEVGGISFNVVRKVGIRITKEYILRDKP
jgi:hypothetical protein